MRRLYLYRLLVKYPDGSLEPGWEPGDWDDWHESADGTIEKLPFSWPRVRLYMTSAGAEARADLLRAYGVEVTIDRSLPVRWIEQEQLPGLEGDE